MNNGTTVKTSNRRACVAILKTLVIEIIVGADLCGMAVERKSKSRAYSGESGYSLRGTQYDPKKMIYDATCEVRTLVLTTRPDSVRLSTSSRSVFFLADMKYSSSSCCTRETFLAGGFWPLIQQSTQQLPVCIALMHAGSGGRAGALPPKVRTWSANHHFGCIRVCQIPEHGE